MTKWFWINRITLAMMAFETKEDAVRQGNAGTIIEAGIDHNKFASLPEYTLNDFANLFNELADEKVKRFRDKPQGASKLLDIMNKKLPVTPASEEVKVPEAEPVGPITKPPKPKQKRSGGRRGNRDKCLYSTDGKNPMRASSKSGWTIQQIIDNPGIKYQDLVDAGGRANAINGAIRMGAVEVRDGGGDDGKD